MIKDWIKNIFVDDDGVIEWPSAAEYVAPPQAGSWTTNMEIGQEHITWPQAPVIVVSGTRNADLAATEAQDAAAFLVLHVLDADLAATEAQDAGSFTALVLSDRQADLAATDAQDAADFELAGEEEEEGGWSEYVPLYYIPLNARLAATEAQDTAAFTLAFDYTDEDLVMSLMMAAWDEDEIYQQPPGRR